MACSPLAAVLDVGRVVCGEKGKYKLTKRLGNGWGMASLFKAQKLETGNGLDTKWLLPSHHAWDRENIQLTVARYVGSLSKRALRRVGQL